MPRLLCFMLCLLFSTSCWAANPAPAFTLDNSAGQPITFPREHDGVDIYFFWASWCPYCKALMPHLQSIIDEYGDNIEVFAFNIRDDVDPELFLAKSGYDFMLMPEADELMPLYGVKGTPGVFLVDGSGQIRLNLYSLVYPKLNMGEDLKNSQKAARMAPWWAAQIREQIDQILTTPAAP